eukprot:SAG31_NODE_6904_length_1857_cov_1.201365_2_plen_424_part_00
MYASRNPGLIEKVSPCSVYKNFLTITGLLPEGSISNRIDKVWMPRPEIKRRANSGKDNMIQESSGQYVYGVDGGDEYSGTVDPNGANRPPLGCERCCYRKWSEHIHPCTEEDNKDWRSFIADSEMLKRIPELAVNPFRDQFIRIFSELHRLESFNPVNAEDEDDVNDDGEPEIGDQVYWCSIAEREAGRESEEGSTETNVEKFKTHPEHHDPWDDDDPWWQSFWNNLHIIARTPAARQREEEESHPRLLHNSLPEASVDVELGPKPKQHESHDYKRKKLIVKQLRDDAKDEANAKRKDEREQQAECMELYYEDPPATDAEPRIHDRRRSLTKSLQQLREHIQPNAQGSMGNCTVEELKKMIVEMQHLKHPDAPVLQTEDVRLFLGTKNTVRIEPCLWLQGTGAPRCQNNCHSFEILKQLTICF